MVGREQQSRAVQLPASRKQIKGARNKNTPKTGAPMTYLLIPSPILQSTNINMSVVQSIDEVIMLMTQSFLNGAAR